MAKFNPEISSNLGSNWTNASNRSSGDTSFGDLFKDLSAVAVNYNNKKEQDDKRNLALEVDAKVNQLGEDVIGGDAATVGGEIFAEPEQVPDGINKAKARLSSLKAGYSQGKFSDGYYQTNLAKTSKELRAKYPQYADTIDDLISNASGTSMANKIRKGIVAEFEEEAKNATDTEKMKFQLLKENSEYLGDQEFLTSYKRLTKKDFNPNDFNEKAMVYAVGGVKQGQSEVTRAKQKLELFEGETKAKKTLAKDAATKEVTLLRDKLLYSTLNESNKGTKLDFDNLEKMVRENSSAGSTLDPEELKAINGIYARLNLELNVKADQLLSGMDKDGNSYATYLDSKERDEVKKLLFEPLDTFSKILGVGDGGDGTVKLGLAAAVKMDTNIRREAKENSLLKNVDMLNAVKDASSVWGEAKVNDILTRLQSDPRMQETSKWEPQDKAIANKLTLMMMGGKSISEVLFLYSQESDASGQAANLAVNTTLDVLNDPTVTPEAKLSAAKKIYADDEKKVLEKFASNDPEKLFDKYVNAELTRQFKGTEVWSDYSEWAMAQSKPLLKKYGQEMLSMKTGTDAGILIFDEKSKRFTYGNAGPLESAKGAIGAGVAVPGVANVAVGYDQYRTQKGMEAAAAMNRHLDAMKPILETNGLTEEEFLESMFMSKDFNKIAKEGSFLTRMKDKFFEYMINPEAGKAKGEPVSKERMLNPLGPRSEGVIDAGKGWTAVKSADGTVEKRIGARNWRNNNPGNIEYGAFAKKLGAVGTDGRFAVFPSYEAGRRAKEALLFESASYKNKTIQQAINRYAPEFENDSVAYAKNIAAAAGVSTNAKLNTLNPDQRQKMLTAMQAVEGWKEGKVVKQMAAN